MTIKKMVGIATAIIALLLLAASVHADDHARDMSPEEKAMMEAYEKAGATGPQHAMMAKSTGDYALQIKSWNEPGTEPSESTGSATRTMILGGRRITEKMQATVMGQSFVGHGMNGYDNVTGRYWSTWNDSMSTGVMVSDGSCNEAGVCEFTGSWHDPITKKKVASRMVIKPTDDGEFFEMFGPGPDGKEAKMMEVTYTRK